MIAAESPSPPPSDLLADLAQHVRIARAINQEREALNQAQHRVRREARDLAGRMVRAGVGTVEVDGWLLWPDPACSGLHRRKAPVPLPGAERHA